VTTALTTSTSRATSTLVYERLTLNGSQTEVVSASDYNTIYWDGSQWTEN
jgi:hypothetical protein